MKSTEIFIKVSEFNPFDSYAIIDGESDLCLFTNLHLSLVIEMNSLAIDVDHEIRGIK